MFFVLLKIFCLAEFVFGAKLPSNFTKCNRSDPNLQTCLKDAALDAIQKLSTGNKELGIPSLEPLFISEMSVGGGGGNVNIDQNYKNIYLHGLTKSKVLSFHMNIDGNKLVFESFTPVVIIESDYNLKGQLSIFPINGKGKSNQTLYNLKLNNDVTLDKFTKKGKEYYRVTEWRTEFHQENVHFEFSGLIQRNDQLSKEISKVLAENSNAIFDEAKAGYEKAYGELFKTLANILFTRVPIDQIFLK